MVNFRHHGHVYLQKKAALADLSILTSASIPVTMKLSKTTKIGWLSQTPHILVRYKLSYPWGIKEESTTHSNPYIANFHLLASLEEEACSKRKNEVNYKLLTTLSTT